MTTTVSEFSFPGRAVRRTVGTRLLMKRVFDLVVAVTALVVLSPVLLLIATVLLITEGRPVLFRQERVGRYGHPFVMWKFRTMVIDAESRLADLQQANERSGPLFKMNADPRVTRIGQFLRATSLDELPQLLNVVTGTMSLVGPRPALFEERDSFTPELLAREEMPPGITGLWQVEARTEGDFDRYRQLDLAYVENWTLRLDLWLLVRTPFALIGQATSPAIDSAESIAEVTPFSRSIPLSTSDSFEHVADAS